MTPQYWPGRRSTTVNDYKGRTIPIQKDILKGNEARNYCPITCLPLTWKLLTGKIGDEIYGFLENKSILPEEQKGSRRKTKGTRDQLYRDKMLFQEVKRRFIRFRLSESLWHGAPTLCDREVKYDGHSKKCGECFGENDEVQEGGVNLPCWDTREVTKKKEIFQGDALSPLDFVTALIPLKQIMRTANPGYGIQTGETINHLLFMDDLALYSESERALYSPIQARRIFSEDTGMQIGIDQCALLVIKKGETVKSDGVELPNKKVDKSRRKELWVFRCARSKWNDDQWNEG